MTTRHYRHDARNLHRFSSPSLDEGWGVHHGRITPENSSLRQPRGRARRKDRHRDLALSAEARPDHKKGVVLAYSRGVVVGRGKVFLGTVDGRGIAVDQKTGKEVWQVQLTDFSCERLPAADCAPLIPP